jgi:hypothetical protein
MKYLIFGIVITFMSCKKDSVTLSNTIFANNSTHQIIVQGFKNGVNDIESSFVLNPNETKSVFTLNNRGIGNGLSFGEYYRPIDYFLVQFDGQYKISHYKSNLIGTNPKRYLFTSIRNIYNDSNYIKNITKDEKYRREWDFKYTFTEQDYLDAR